MTEFDLVLRSVLGFSATFRLGFPFVLFLFLSVPAAGSDRASSLFCCFLLFFVCFFFVFFEVSLSEMMKESKNDETGSSMAIDFNRRCKQTVGRFVTVLVIKK